MAAKASILFTHAIKKLLQHMAETDCLQDQVAMFAVILQSTETQRVFEL
jgi:hypothetical protein